MTVLMEILAASLAVAVMAMVAIGIDRRRRPGSGCAAGGSCRSDRYRCPEREHANTL